MSDNPLYKLQEAVETAAELCIANPQVKVFSRRKGNVKNDIESAIARIGVAVIVSAPLPLEYSASGVFNLYVDKATIALQIMENVALNKKAPNAFSLLTALVKHFHNAVIDIGNGQQITFTLDKVIDASPDEAPIVTLIQPLNFSITL